MKQLKKPFVIILPVLFFLIAFFPLVFAAEEPSHSLDLVIKISNLEEKLQLINSLTGEGTSTDNSPAVFINKVLQGTDWIDTDRLIVLGGLMNQDQFEGAALIPFKKPNPDVQASMKAAAGPDYYILGFPTGGTQTTVSKAIESGLIESSKTGTKEFFSIEVSVSQLR